MTDAATEIVEAREAMPADVMLDRFVALLQQRDIDHIDLTIQVRNSGEIAQLRISLISEKPRRNN